jgi:SAM-dependent methyltransferase
MTASSGTDFIVAERERIQVEYERRAREVSPDKYAAWQPAELFMVETRNRTAASMLHELNVFPRLGDHCLEVGYGNLGWLSELINWGIAEPDVHGIELNAKRAAHARQLLPAADLRIGDAVELPWKNDTFQLVITSTLFTSVLDREVQELIAGEIERVLAPGGVLLWYDFAYDNPRNANVRGIRRNQIKKLFPSLRGNIKSVTLAPPLARLVAPRSLTLANLLEGIPFLRTHLLAVLVKAES